MQRDSSAAAAYGASLYHLYKQGDIQQDWGVALPDTCLIIILAKLVSFSLITISANRTHIEHAISELNEGSSLDWDV